MDASDEEVWCECSDEEMYNPGKEKKGTWQPKPEDILKLFEELKTKKVLKLKWKCPGRRHPDSEKNTTEEKTEQVVMTPSKHENKPAELSKFDFEDEFSDSKTVLVPRNTPGSAPKSVKKVAKMDKVLQDMMQQRKKQAAEREARKQGSARSPRTPSSPARARVGSPASSPRTPPAASRARDPITTTPLRAPIDTMPQGLSPLAASRDLDKLQGGVNKADIPLTSKALTTSAAVSISQNTAVPVSAGSQSSVFSQSLPTSVLQENSEHSNTAEAVKTTSDSVKLNEKLENMDTT